jgi:hypothetical protein
MFPQNLVKGQHYYESQVLKGSYKVFHRDKLFQLGQIAQMVCISVKMLNIGHKLSVSKKHTLGMNFYGITTISNIQDPNR